MNRAHGKHYDGKNLSHCIRLLTMANEIADGKGVIVRRNPEEVSRLLSIKRGEYEYDDLISEANALMKESDRKYDDSGLPQAVNVDMLDRMLVKIRRGWYGLRAE